MADAAEIAPQMDAVFLVYTVGKIGRGVLKRAKSNLDNVDAKVLGVILNNVKPEAGPEYFKYHSQHYYGPEGEDTHRKRSIKKWLDKIKITFTKWTIVKYSLLLVAIALLSVGIFWQDVQHFTSEWFNTLKGLFLSP